MNADADAFPHLINKFPPRLQHSVGATYFGWGWANNEVQRKRCETVLGTIASPGACVEGELSLQASVMGELQRGCEGTARMAAADGGEQSVEVMPDTEGRMNALAAKLRHRPMQFSFLFCRAVCHHRTR